MSMNPFQQASEASMLSIQQLQKAVQDGTLPPYIGIPLIQQKTQMSKEAQALAAGQQRSVPVAQQVLQEAQQHQGVQALPSGLPTEEMAHGGIIAFADGGMYDDEDTDEDRIDAAREQEINDLMDEYAQTFQGGIGQLPAAKKERIVTEDTPDFIARIMHKESRGKRYGKNGELLESSKGALGEMQVMPKTISDPGFGIKPAQGNNPDEIARVGREYAQVMLDRYKDPKVAAIAYNWGPGNTDKWLASGADMSKLPAETQGYVKGFAGGGDVKHFDAGDLVSSYEAAMQRLKDVASSASDSATSKIKDIFSMSPDEIASAQRAKIASSAANAAPQAAGAVAESGLPGLWDATKSAISRIRPGAAAWELGLHHGELNPNEQEELAKRWAKVDSAGLPNIPRAHSTMANDPRLLTARPVINKVSPYDTEDARVVDSAGLAGAQMPAPAVAQEKVDPYQEFKDIFNRREENLAKQREMDKYMALMSAGFGMMGGTSPNALANIGAGAQQGIASLMAANKDRTAEENALLSGRLGLAKIGTAKEQADAMMKLRQDMQNQAIAQRDAAANAAIEEKRQARIDRGEGKTEKLLSDIEDKVRAGVAKDIAGNVVLQNKPDIETIKEQMVQERLRAHKTYGKKYKEHYGEDPFEGFGGTNTGGGTRMSPERAGQFKVER